MASIITIDGWREEERRENSAGYGSSLIGIGILQRGPVIRSSGRRRLRTAKELEQEADRLGEESVRDRLGHRTRGGEGEQGTNPQFAVRSGK
jgi:hypothetical protein